MSIPALNPEDLGIIILVIVIAVWAIITKVLNNQRKVIRNELHGTVTYTIKGYNGVESLRIAKALEKGQPPTTEPDPDELEHRTLSHDNIMLTKATREDVRR